MGMHIEDIENDDFGMEEQLRKDYIYWTGGEKSGCKKIVNGGKVTLGVPAAMLVSKDMCKLHEILPLISEKNKQELLNINLRLCDVDNFARGYYMSLRSELEKVFFAYKKEQLQIVGEWQGWRTFVELSVFLQWAQQKGYTIPPELTPLLQGEKCTARRGKNLSTEPEITQRKEAIRIYVCKYISALPEGELPKKSTIHKAIKEILPEGIYNDESLDAVIAEEVGKDTARFWKKAGRPRKNN